ncbi:hypothetical protein [Microbacterium sp. 1.5R]|uniref:hypothetical protein n=1 Tax=Microbacterium sp. 1.5R TaxID=1916917 RepID=UPI0011A55BD1|nr:hypothetical protein [Microbacterium sp. 1.5R]
MHSGVRPVTRRRRALATTAVVALALLTACTPKPAPEASSSASPSPAPSTPAPYDGPVQFVGDELALFALTAKEIAGVFPGSPPAGSVTDHLTEYSDGGGPPYSPEVCAILVAEPSLRSIGARVIPWEGVDGDASTGAQQILQYPSEEHAADAMTQLLSTVDQCAQFDADGPGSFDAVLVPDEDGVRALAGTFSADFSGNPWTAHHEFVSAGNVLVHLWQPSPDEGGFDAESAAVLLRDRAVAAQQSLIEKLTDEPPETSEPEPVDPASAWNEWEFTPDGVGPLRLGDARETVLAAAPGATSEEIVDGAYVRLRSPDGAASLVLHFTEQDQLESITAGDANIVGDGEFDGAALPAAGGVRVGASLVDAVTAFPMGTYVRVVSSGEYFYRWATRDGRVIDFRADRSTDDQDAMISGVTVTDATLAPTATHLVVD